MAGDADDSEKYGVKTEVIGVLTILGVLVVQYGAHSLDKVVENRKSLKEIVNMMYRELMILGLVAFALFVVESSDLVTISETDKHVFEEVHFTLFLVAVIYGLMVVAVAYFSYSIDRTWKHYEAMQTVSGQWLEIRENFEALSRRLGAPTAGEEDNASIFRHTWRFFFHPLSWMNYKMLLEHVRFHELRAHFIRANHMPRNFAFAGYLKKCKQHVMLELVEVRSSAWVLIAWLVSVDLFIEGLDDGALTGPHVAGIMSILSAFVIALSGVVYFKINDIYWRLLHSDFIHYDPNKPEAHVVPADVRRGHQESLFWLGSPGLLIDMLQFIQFVVAVNFAVAVQNIKTAKEDGSGSLAAMLVMLSLALLSFFALLPVAIPRYTMATHVGEFVDRDLLSKALKKQQRQFKSRALPPSLRQAFALAEHEAQGGSDPRARLRYLLNLGIVKAAFQGLVLLYFFALSYQNHWLANTEEDSSRRLAGSLSDSLSERFLASGGGSDWSDVCTNVSPDGRCYNQTLLTFEVLIACILMVLEFLTSAAFDPPGESYWRAFLAGCGFDLLVTTTSGIFMFVAANMLLEGGAGDENVVAVHSCSGIIILKVLRPLRLHERIEELVVHAYASAEAYYAEHRGGGASVGRGGTRPSLYVRNKGALALDRPLYVDSADPGKPLEQDPHPWVNLNFVANPTRLEPTQSPPAASDVEMALLDRGRSNVVGMDGGESKTTESPADQSAPTSPLEPTTPSRSHSDRALARPESTGARKREDSDKLPKHIRVADLSGHVRSLSSRHSRRLTPFDIVGVHEYDDEIRREHGKQAMAMQIWQDVCKSNPDVVAAEGKLSVPVLRLMLGLAPYDPNAQPDDTGSRASSESGTVSDGLAYSDMDDNLSGYDEESEGDGEDAGEGRRLLSRAGAVTTKQMRRYDGQRERFRRANTGYDGSDNDSTSQSPRGRRKRFGAMSGLPNDDDSVDVEDTESIILPKPRPSFLKRATSLLGFEQSSPRESPLTSEANVLAHLSPPQLGREVSIESRMFNRMVSQTGLSIDAREAQESWAEERWLGKLLKRGDGFKRAPPELPRWKETHILLTRKELAFVPRGQKVQIENGVLYSAPGLRKRVALSMITGISMIDHDTILKVQTPHMAMQIRGVDQADTWSWHSQLQEARRGSDSLM